MINEEKEGKSPIISTPNKKNTIIFIIGFLFLIVLFHLLINKTQVCGDGTIEGICSERKPYFCSSDGILVEKASVCGCSETLKKIGDSCISKYQINQQNITLKYTLRGEGGEIYYPVYGGMIDYISTLPKSISYEENESPSRMDFKLRNLNELEQRELLLPLVTEIQNLADDKEDQFRVAVSLAQNIEWGSSNKTTKLRNSEVNYSRYPYEVLYESSGLCGEKSELLAFILREVGYDVSFFYFQEENHEALGVRCPVDESFDDTGYCLVETTAPSIITDDKIEYDGGVRLFSKPEVIGISDGEALPRTLYEYKDAEKWKKIREDLKKDGEVNFFNYLKFKSLTKKYNLDPTENYNLG